MGLLQRLLEPLRNQRGQVVTTPRDPFTGEPLTFGVVGGDPLMNILAEFTQTGGPSTGPRPRGPSPPSPEVPPEQITFPGAGPQGTGPRQSLADLIAQQQFQQEVERAQAFDKAQADAARAATAAPGAGGVPVQTAVQTGLPALQPTPFRGAPQGAPVGIGFAPGSAGAQLGQLIQQIVQQLSGGLTGGPTRESLLDPRLADIGEQFGGQRQRTAERFAALGRSPVSTPQQQLQQRLTQRETTERQRAMGNVDAFLAQLNLNRQQQLLNLLANILSGAPGALGQGGAIRV